MIIINIRGTHGSGKSTIVKAVMDRYPSREASIVAGRKRPLGYTCRRDDGLALWVPGHYETACGGCDTILSVDAAYETIYKAVRAGHDVIFEGILIGHDVRRACELRASGVDVTVLVMTTPLDVCLTAVRERRGARGDDREMKPDNVFKGRNSYLIHQPKRFQAAGVRVIKADRDEAMQECLRLLKLPQTLVEQICATPANTLF